MLYLQDDGKCKNINEEPTTLTVKMETSSNIDLKGLYGEYLQLTDGVYKDKQLFIPPGYKQLKGFSELTQHCLWKAHYDPRLLKIQTACKTSSAMFTVLPMLKTEDDVKVIESNLQIPDTIHIVLSSDYIYLKLIDTNQVYKEIGYDLLRVKKHEDILEIESPTVRLVIRSSYANDFQKQIEHLISVHNGATDFLSFETTELNINLSSAVPTINRGHRSIDISRLKNISCIYESPTSVNVFIYIF